MSTAAHSQHRSGGSDANGGGEHNQLGAAHGEGVVAGGGSPTRAAISARFDLYRRLCQGLVTAEELLPADMISQSVQLLPATATSGDHTQHARESNTPPRQDPEEKGSRCEPITVHDTRAAPGLLHEFIKHVRPFSLCLDPSGPSSRVEQPLSETSLPHKQADTTGISVIGGESHPCQAQEGPPSFGRLAQDGEGAGGRQAEDGNGGEGWHAQDGEGGGGRYAQDEKGGGVMAIEERSGGSVGAHDGLSCRAPSSPTALILTGTGPDLDVSGAHQEIRGDRDDARASHPQETHATSTLSLWRPKMPLHGKRKIFPSSTSAASVSGDPGTTATAHLTTSGRKKVSIKAEKGARRETKGGMKSGGRSGLNTGGDVSWSSLTWKSAQSLRKRVETAARTGNVSFLDIHNNH